MSIEYVLFTVACALVVGIAALLRRLRRAPHLPSSIAMPRENRRAGRIDERLARLDERARERQRRTDELYRSMEMLKARGRADED